MKVLFLTVSSGFSNRMLPLLSCWTWCKDKNVALAVIWYPKTHKAGVERVEDGNYFTLSNYFESIPKGITVFKSFHEAYTFHLQGVQKQVYHHNMQWQKSFPLHLLENEYLHLSDCCFLISLYPEFQDVVGNRCDLPQEVIDNYENHPYIKKITENFQEFKLKPEIIEIGDKLVTENLTPIQLRLTDGGFTQLDNPMIINRLYKLIEMITSQNKIPYFTNDRIKEFQYIKEKYPGVVMYDDLKKFINNDQGSFYSLVDFYVLSKCKEAYVIPFSSFTLLAYLYNTRKDKKLLYWVTEFH